MSVEKSSMGSRITAKAASNDAVRLAPKADASQVNAVKKWINNMVNKMGTHK